MNIVIIWILVGISVYLGFKNSELKDKVRMSKKKLRKLFTDWALMIIIQNELSQNIVT